MRKKYLMVKIELELFQTQDVVLASGLVGINSDITIDDIYGNAL